MLVGYMRVSPDSDRQSTALQRDALLAAGVDSRHLDTIIAALDGGMSKAAVCRNFGVKRTTLIETLARVGWTVSHGTPS
jgi:DNA invertase Pin-like site-specific DNA recombinase